MASTQTSAAPESVYPASAPACGSSPAQPCNIAPHSSGECLFENVNDTILIHTLPGQVLHVNRIACQRLGYSRAELLQLQVSQIDTPEYAAQYAERVQLIEQNHGLVFESCHQSKTGERLPVEVNARRIEYDGVPAILSASRDIRARKRAEEELRRQTERLEIAEAQYRNIFENAVEGIFQSTVDGRYLNVNSAMARIFGYASPEDMVTSVGNDIAHKVYADPRHRAEFIRQLADRGVVRDFVAPNRRKDGALIWVNSNARAVHDADGRVLYYEGFVEDITERKHIEMALRYSETRYRILMEQAAAGITVINAQGKFVDANSLACAMLGYSHNELLQKSVGDILAPGSLEQIPIPFTTMREGKTVTLERIMQRQDGAQFPVEVRMRMLPDNTFHGIFHDISERKRLEAQVQAMLETQRKWNADLEANVRAKTSELQRLSELRDQLLRQIITTQEEEHRRVARELHDDTSQALTALIANLAVVQNLPPAKLKGQLSEIKAAVVEILKGVNQIVLDLRPTLLDDYGLMPALSWYANKRLGPGLRVELDTPEPELRLPPIIETTLFRVGQEAIANVAKHARATCLRMRLGYDVANASITLQVADDGCGFAPAQVKQQKDQDRPRLGLLGMHERMQLIGGQLHIGSEPGKGTLITATVTLESGNQEE